MASGKKYPLRFRLLLLLVLLAFTAVGYFAFLKPSPPPVITKYNYRPLAQLKLNAPDRDKYFSGDYEAISASKPIEVTLPTGANKTRISLNNVHPDLPNTGGDFETAIKSNEKGLIAEAVPKSSQAKPGLYKLQTTNPVTGQIVSDQTVAWGVLVFNPDYAIYPIGVKAKLAMAALDDRGKMICDADMTLTITAPDGQVESLSTDNNRILVNEACFVYGQTPDPDYLTEYQPTQVGDYQVTLVARVGKGIRTLHDKFAVANDTSFYLQRLGASRTFPPASYPYTLSFQPRVSGHYQVTERVPASFIISDTNAKVTTRDGYQTLTWQFAARARRPVALTFTFKTPSISPFLFELGPAEITSPDNSTWVEPRAWVIASDNACQSLATGNWSASGSWQTCGGTVPQATDTVTILNGHNITEDTASVTVAGVTINNGGTLTVSTTNQITVSGSWLNSGTFTAASSTVTFSSTTTGKTVNGTLSGSSAFYDLVFNGIGGEWSIGSALTVGNDLTLTNGHLYGNSNPMTVTRDFTLANNAGNAGYVPSAGATTTVSRDWSDAGFKMNNTFANTVVLNGTGNAYGVFNVLSVAYSGKTTTFVTGTSDLQASGTSSGTLTTNGGVVTGTSVGINTHCSTSCTPVTVGVGTTFTGSGNSFGLFGGAASITVSLAGADYGTWSVGLAASYNSVTIELSGDVVTTGGLNLNPATGTTGCVFNTNDHAITAPRFVWGNSGNAGPCTVNLGSSTLTLAAGAASLAFGVNNNSGAYTLNMNSSQTTTNGNLVFVDGTATVTTNPGTSTVTWNNTSGTSTFTPNGQSLYNVVRNGTGGTLTPQAAMVVTNDLTMTAGTINGTQNITVNGNVTGTAGAFSLTGGTFTQRVSASKNFGTTSGATTWTFFALAFSNSNAGATPVTITTQTGGTGGISTAAGGTLLVGVSGDAAGATTTLDAGNRTWTIQGTGGNPFQLLASPAAGFAPSTSTVTINGTNAGGTTVQNTTYNNLIIGRSPICSNATFNAAGAITVSATTTINSCGIFSLTASNYALTTGKIVISGTFQPNDATVTLTGTTSTLFTRTGIFTQGNSNVVVTSASGTPTLLSAATTFHILTINSAATVINAGQAITTDNNAGNKLYVQSGVFNLEGRTVTPGTAGTLQVDSAGTFCLGGTTGSTAATCDSGATQTGASTFPAFATVTLDASSTVIYLADVAQTVLETVIYGNLNLTPKMSASRTYTMGGAMTINGHFNVKPKASAGSLALTVNLAGTTTVAATKTTTIQPDSTNSPTATLDATASNFNLVTGLVDIETSGTLNIRNASGFTLTGTTGTLFTRVGTFTIGGSSTTIFNGNGSPTLTSNHTLTFDTLNLTPNVSGGGKNYTFGSGTLTINGDFNIKPVAAAASQSLTVNMGAHITVASTGTTTVQPNAVSSVTAKLDSTAANYNLTTGLLNVSSSGGGGTLDIRNSTLTLTGTSGTIFTRTGTFTVGGSSTTIFNGDGSATALTSNNVITFDTLQLTPAMSVSRSYTFGSSALTINGNFDIKPTATAGSTILTVNMGADITVGTTKSTTIQPGATNSPSAILDTRPAATDYNLTTGDLNIESGGTLDAGSSAAVITIAGNYLNNGTLTAGSSTFTFTATTTGETLSGTLTGSPGQFFNLTFNGSGGGWSASSTMTVANDLTMTLGTLSGTNNITVSGGDFSGDGTVNLTGGTVTITGIGNLAGNTAWTFNNLTIGTGSTAATTSAIGSGGITVSSTLTISAKFVASGNELKAGTKTWTIAGGSNCPFYVCANLAAAGTTFTAETSTFTYTGNNGAGNVGVANTTFYNLIINNGSETFNGGAGTSTNNDLTITAGTFDETTSNFGLTVKGNYTNSGVYTARTGTVTFSGTATQTLSGTLTGSSAFYNLTLTNASGAVSGCSTSFTPGVSFAASVTVTNNYTAITANTKVQYNSGSTYTFSNINWNGQAAGTKVYFRNSNLSSGSWLLNVSGTQTAVSYVDVGRSDASSGSTINAADGTNNNCSNNTNWSFFAPNSVANLAQKKTDDTVISTGGWTNETSVKFTADISDGDNPATIYLCVEKDLLGTSFSNTEDACGGAVAYSGSALATSVTISGLVDTSEYHWQARVKDSSGVYSAWTSYGGNAESARDYGIDTTACATATIYDGLSIGVDAVYNDGSLVALSANWDAFGCTVSSLNFYEYSIGTTSGSTDITNWTNNGNEVAATQTGLNLHTNLPYFFNIRATDNANNLSGVASSNGQTVLPQISFSLSSNAVTFATLEFSNNHSDSKTTTLTTGTNAYGGYVVTQYVSGLLNNGTSTIPMFSAGSYATPAAWPAGDCSGTTCGFGYTSNDPLVQGSNKFNGGLLYAPYSTTPAGDIVADHTVAVNGSSGAVSNESFIITHKVATSSIQAPGSYQTTIYYIVTGNF